MQSNSRKSDDALGGGRFRKIVIWMIVAVVALGAASMLPMMVTGADNDAIIKIPANTTQQNLTDTLTKYLGSDYAGKVMKMIKLRKIDLSKRHGAYLIPKGTSPFRAMRKLGRGAQTPVKLTINGFRGLDVMAERMAMKLECSKEDLIKAFTNPQLLKPYGLSPQQALSLFVDDTYEVYWTSTPEDIMKKVGDNYLRIWNDTRKDKASKLGLTPEQVMTVASIVEEETTKKDEKGAVGRLYINRLQKGMRLQADPTIRYALGDFTIKRVRGEHLNVESPYNTYRHEGLPPGPIRTTSVETIDLILDSEPSDYLYMCAREDFSGYHNFAETYGEHMQNAFRYQHALDSQGIK